MNLPIYLDLSDRMLQIDVSASRKVKKSEKSIRSRHVGNTSPHSNDSRQFSDDLARENYEADRKLHNTKVHKSRGFVVYV